MLEPLKPFLHLMLKNPHPPKKTSVPATLEWVVISFSRDLPDQGIKPKSPALAGKFFTTEPPGKPLLITGLPHMSALWRNLPPTPS